MLHVHLPKYKELQLHLHQAALQIPPAVPLRYIAGHRSSLLDSIAVSDALPKGNINSTTWRCHFPLGVTAVT